jgi:hypothetical protein
VLQYRKDVLGDDGVVKSPEFIIDMIQGRFGSSQAS